RLGANSLVSCIFGGGIAGPAAVKLARNADRSTETVDSSVFEREKKRQGGKNKALIPQNATENPITTSKEPGETMTAPATVTRINKNLQTAATKIADLRARYRKINLSDRTLWSNPTLNFARELENMLILAQVITAGALCRNESRGAHYKPEFP